MTATDLSLILKQPNHITLSQVYELENIIHEYPYFQVVTDNSLFSFISNKERINDNRRMCDLTIDDFHSLKQYMLCFNEGGVVTRENICRPNYRSNVNTFLIDIAMPYVDNGKVKVKHITYGYLEDYHKFKHMGYEPVYNTFAEEYIVE